VIIWFIVQNAALKMMITQSFVSNAAQVYAQEPMNHDVTNAEGLNLNVSGFLMAAQSLDWLLEQ